MQFILSSRSLDIEVASTLSKHHVTLVTAGRDVHCLTMMTCTVDMIDECVRKLMRGKASGHDDLTVEHVQNSHPVLTVLLSLLFNMVICHGMVPDDFGKGIIIPLIKNSEGNKRSSDNYRGITLSPVLSKLFEMILLNDLQSCL